MLQELCILKRDREKMCLTGEGMEEFEKHIDVKMLLNNQITGFLPLQIQYIDEKSVYSYSLQGMTALTDLLEEDILDFFLAEKIYQGILSVRRMGQEFFLEESHFVLEPSYLFWDIRKKRLMVCYFPGYQLPLEEQVTALNEFLLKHINHKDKRCVSLVYGVYELIENRGFVDADIASYLRRFGEKGEKYKEGSEEREGKEKRFETKGEGGQGNEMRIGIRNLSKWRALPEWVEVCHDRFTIGRSQENDFVIPAMWISFQHARIDRRESQFYVTDLGSTNGVYLNGKKLISNHPVLCRMKDIISFADIAYCLEGK